MRSRERTCTAEEGAGADAVVDLDRRKEQGDYREQADEHDIERKEEEKAKLFSCMAPESSSDVDVSGGKVGYSRGGGARSLVVPPCLLRLPCWRITKCSWGYDGRHRRSNRAGEAWALFASKGTRDSRLSAGRKRGRGQAAGAVRQEHGGAAGGGAGEWAGNWAGSRRTRPGVPGPQDGKCCAAHRLKLNTGVNFRSISRCSTKYGGLGQGRGKEEDTKEGA
jgi:hypothetical protein